MIKCNKFVATLFSVTLLLGNLPKVIANENVQEELSNKCVTNFYGELDITQRFLLVELDKQTVIANCHHVFANLYKGVSVETLYENQRREFLATVREKMPNLENHPVFLELIKSYNYALIAAGVNSYCPRYQEDLDNLKTRLEEEIEDDNDNLPYVIDSQYRMCGSFSVKVAA